MVFYNGTSSKVKNDVEKIRLSDAFYTKDSTGEFEWTATMININIGQNHELFEKCQVLEHYSIFIHRVREYNSTMKNLETAINRAVDECISEGILKDVLETQKREGFNLVLTEFDEEKFEAMLRAEGREEGITIGIEEGIIQNLCTLVAKKRITIKEALEECSLTKTEFLEKMKEFGLDTK